MAARAAPRYLRRLSLGVAVIGLSLTVFFGLRTYGSFLLLRSAHDAGAPMTSSVRGWMTLDYISGAFDISGTVLAERLGLPLDIEPTTTLKSLAGRAEISPPLYVQRVQRALAEVVPKANPDGAVEKQSLLGRISDEILTSLLIYGYPILALTLLLGSMGLPLPDGALTTFAGSLAAQGRLNWIVASVLVVAASVTGDAIAYGLGRVFDRKIIDRHGRWIGYTPARWRHVQLLFDRWGSLAIFVTRTFMSYLSSVASLLAGMSGFGFSKFLMVSLAGRIVWTGAYLGLGYGIGSDLEAATGFLTNLSALLLSLMVFAGASVLAAGWTPAQR
jgi:membrane protein DedA with SNARE-associated domain